MPNEDDEDLTMSWPEPKPGPCRHLQLETWRVRKERTLCGVCHEDITDQIESILLGTK